MAVHVPRGPGSTERQAQTNRRKVLHTLRRALPGADGLIEIGPRTLRWRADPLSPYGGGRFYARGEYLLNQNVRPSHTATEPALA